MSADADPLELERSALDAAFETRLNATLDLAQFGDESLKTVALPTGLDFSIACRYQILRHHARGGLGDVFVALDGELNREVALKQIQTRHVGDVGSRARFVQEAEITGRLEHPNIVPIYGLGCYADGRPYYAMRFIHGESLRDACTRFHAANPRLPDLQHSLEFRSLLSRFIAVCHAVDYAHSRGVLHRDLKPDNVMLGKFGETLVVDWGLAKTAGRAEPAASAKHESGESIAATTGVSTHTAYGTALGTPAYMSPEQAAGNLDRLGPASDIYSLGATLYHLLVGRPPLESSDLGEILRRAQIGDFAAPRRVRAEVPAALEAVCLRAMEQDPRRRYESAKAMADDLEQWLADEPVGAHREGVRTRLARWTRKHQAAVSAGAALATATIVALVVGLALVDDARQAATEAHENESIQRRLAEQQRRFAVDSLSAELTVRQELLELQNEYDDQNEALEAIEDQMDLARIDAAQASTAQERARVIVGHVLEVHVARLATLTEERDAYLKSGGAAARAARLQKLARERFYYEELLKGREVDRETNGFVRAVTVEDPQAWAGWKSELEDLQRTMCRLKSEIAQGERAVEAIPKLTAEIAELRTRLDRAGEPVSAARATAAAAELQRLRRAQAELLSKRNRTRYALFGE